MPVVLKPYCKDCHMELERVEMPTGNRKLMSDEEEMVWDSGAINVTKI